MTKRAKITWGLAGGLVLLGGWWLLLPRIHTASEADVRAHIASRWLEPLPHPTGGRERYQALQRDLEVVMGQSPVHPETVVSLDLTNPAVAAVVDILRQGPVDSTDDSGNRWSRLRALPSGLSRAALEHARSGDWSGVEQQMEAAYLVVDQLMKSGVTTSERAWALNMETSIHAAVLQLAARSDLPDGTAGHLAALVAVDRDSPDDVKRVLRGDMQLYFVAALATYRDTVSGEPLMWVPGGNYHPLETAEWFSDLFDEIEHNAELPVSRWSRKVADRFGSSSRWPLSPRASLREQLLSPWTRIGMATTHNSIGRYLVANYPLPGRVLNQTLRTHSAQDQASAALAINRFRRRVGRDPHDFEELIAAGLLEAVPMDHQRDKPLPFNLKRLLDSTLYP